MLVERFVPTEVIRVHKKRISVGLMVTLACVRPQAGGSSVGS